MRFKLHSVFTLLILFVFAFALFEARDWPLRASIMILVLGAIGLAFCLVELYLELRIPSGKAKNSGMDIDLDESETGKGSTKRVLYSSTWVASLLAGCWIIGFTVSIPLWSFLYAKKHGAKWLTAIVIAVLNFAFLQGIFEQLLRVPWPDPVLRQWILFLPG